jgi:hypothetical protein
MEQCLNAYGLITQIFERIAEAQTPSRFTQDFLSTVLGFKSSSARAFIPLLKKLGFIQSDGTPTDLYKKLRSSSEKGQAMAQAIRAAYAEIFATNEYAQKLDAKKLKDTVIQITGASSDSSTVGAIVGTFQALKALADFDTDSKPKQAASAEPLPEVKEQPLSTRINLPEYAAPSDDNNRKLSLSYTINLNLPETKDPEVFSAIFKSIKEHLLK